MESTMFVGTIWSILPPIIAIVLALITKEVYSSLFIGVAVGALMVGGFDLWASFNAFFDIMKDSIATLHAQVEDLITNHSVPLNDLFANKIVEE